MRWVMLMLAGLCAGAWPAGASDANILHYTARLHGIALLVATVCLRLDSASYSASYSASLSASTVGLADFLVHGRSESQVDGVVTAGGLKPHAYAERGRLSGENHHIAIEFPAGDPVLRVIEPPQEEYRLAVPASVLPGSLDGLSTVVLQTLAATRSGLCLADARVFDGRQLRRLTMRLSGTDMLPRSARSVFSGKALRCDTESVMLAGYLKSTSVKSQTRPRHGQLWLAAVLPGGPAVPVRITFDAELLGEMEVDLDHVAASQTPACGKAADGSAALGAPGTVP